MKINIKTAGSLKGELSLVDISNLTKYHSYGNVIGEKEENQYLKDIKSFESFNGIVGNNKE